MTASTLRSTNLEKLQNQNFDVLIIGGGINGAVSAAALAGRGVKVALIERADFASGASSNSSNLAWGGIKYLESHDYLLVNKLCKSRNELMRTYPSTVKEIRFFTTVQRGFRASAFFVFLGALLYWLMGRCATRPPRYLTAKYIEEQEPEINTSKAAGGLEYSDCYLYDNDARFVFNFIRKSLNYGCVAINYVSCESAQFQNGCWHIGAHDVESNRHFNVQAKVLINACGPYVDKENQLAKISTRHRHLFSKGVHLIVDKVTDNRRVLTFFASDGRLFFLIPMGPKTCIGTTDTRVDTPLVSVTDEDREFILANANSLLDLKKPLTQEDVIAERVGVRPLVIAGAGGADDWLQLSRKHVIEVDNNRCHISIFGGKLTDCLNVGREISRHVQSLGIDISDCDKPWYGEPGAALRDEFMCQAKLMNLDKLTDPSSSEPLSERFWRRYGEAAFYLLERIRADAGCARLVIDQAEYTRCEIELAAQREMIVRLEDFMRRRSKIELVLNRRDITDAPGLREVCDILFGERSQERLDEYLQTLLAE
ncbi:MAG: FAD-dependent oxidoreductase [Parahaliea sp.]